MGLSIDFSLGLGLLCIHSELSQLLEVLNLSIFLSLLHNSQVVLDKLNICLGCDLHIFYSRRGVLISFLDGLVHCSRWHCSFLIKFSQLDYLFSLFLGLFRIFMDLINLVSKGALGLFRDSRKLLLKPTDGSQHLVVFSTGLILNFILCISIG